MLCWYEWGISLTATLRAHSLLVPFTVEHLRLLQSRFPRSSIFLLLAE